MNSVFVAEGVVSEGKFLMVWLHRIQDEEADGEDDDNGIVEYISVIDVSKSTPQLWPCR